MPIDVRLRRGVIAATALTVCPRGHSCECCRSPGADAGCHGADEPAGVHVGRFGPSRGGVGRQRGESPPTEDTPTNAVIGPCGGGLTAAVASIDVSGCPTAVVTGLPASMTATGDVLGADDVAYLDGELYVGVDGGGPGHGHPDHPSGHLPVPADGSAELVADLSTWVRENPVAAIPGDSDPDAAGYSIVVEPESGTLWVDDPNSGQILSASRPMARSAASSICPTRTSCRPAWPSILPAGCSSAP